MNRWPVIIVVMFGTMIVADAIFLYVALTNQDPIVEDYATSDR
jgi:hypothetical protein